MARGSGAVLIDSPRLTSRDRAHWTTLTRYDAALATSPRLVDLADRAREVIRDFAESGPCYVSTSWGKDSTVLAHLAATCGMRLPLVWVRITPWENPDCDLVRDAFLAVHGEGVDYDEIEIDASGVARWWHEDIEGRPKHGPDEGFRVAGARYGDRHVSGVRGEESRVRRIAMGRWGEAGPHAARPIGRWTAVEVFAYLHRHDLPVHPAYAMSHGGRLDRRWLRVSSIGGIRGADKRRADWERAYYPDIVNQPQEDR